MARKQLPQHLKDSAAEHLHLLKKHIPEVSSYATYYVRDSVFLNSLHPKVIQVGPNHWERHLHAGPVRTSLDIIRVIGTSNGMKFSLRLDDDRIHHAVVAYKIDVVLTDDTILDSTNRLTFQMMGEQQVQEDWSHFVQLDLPYMTSEKLFHRNHGHQHGSIKLDVKVYIQDIVLAGEEAADAPTEGKRLMEADPSQSGSSSETRSQSQTQAPKRPREDSIGNGEGSSGNKRTSTDAGASDNALLYSFCNKSDNLENASKIVIGSTSFRNSMMQLRFIRPIRALTSPSSSKAPV